VLKTIDCDAALARSRSSIRSSTFRSESEFAIDHLPGAVNCPVLTDAERVEIGNALQAGFAVRGRAARAPRWWPATSRASAQLPSRSARAHGPRWCIAGEAANAAHRSFT